MDDITFFIIQEVGNEPFIKKPIDSEYKLAKELVEEYPNANIKCVHVMDNGTNIWAESAQMNIEIYDAFEGMEKSYKENDDYNNKILKNIKKIHGEKYYKSLIDCIEKSEGIREYSKLEIVTSPKGEYQPENYDIIKYIYVDQWENGGMEGDSFSGEVYAPLPNNKYLKIPYSM